MLLRFSSREPKFSSPELKASSGELHVSSRKLNVSKFLFISILKHGVVKEEGRKAGRKFKGDDQKPRKPTETQGPGPDLRGSPISSPEALLRNS